MLIVLVEMVLADMQGIRIIVSEDKAALGSLI